MAFFISIISFSAFVITTLDLCDPLPRFINDPCFFCFFSSSDVDLSDGSNVGTAIVCLTILFLLSNFFVSVLFFKISESNFSERLRSLSLCFILAEESEE